MNRDVKALIDRIEVDEHLAHYQRLTLSQRADLLGEMFSFSRSLKRPKALESRLRKLEERKFTPALCRKWLRKISPMKG